LLPDSGNLRAKHQSDFLGRIAVCPESLIKWAFFGQSLSLVRIWSNNIARLINRLINLLYHLSSKKRVWAINSRLPIPLVLASTAFLL
jgi:hypothetical protein